MTRAVVVLEVGARSRGQASVSTPVSRCTSDDLASTESGLPVMLTSRVPMRLSSGSRVTISATDPELDRAMTASSAVIMPISP